MSLGLLPTPTVTICKVAKMVFNVAPGNFYLSQYLEYQKINGTTATVEAMANLAGGTDAAFVTSVLANLGLSDDAGAEAFLTSAVAAGGRGSAIEAAIDALNNLAADDPVYGSAVSTFNTAVTRSVVYSSDEANNSTDVSTLQAAITGAGLTAGSTFTLTTSAETINGSGGDDTVNGQTNASLDDGDALLMGNGTDRVNARYTTDGTYTPTLASVEEVYVRFQSATSTAAVTFDLDDNAGVTLAVADRIEGTTGGQVLTFDNMDLSTTAGVEKGDGAADVTFTYSSTTGSADEASLALMDADVGTVDIGNIETLNITGSQGASTVDVMSAAEAETLNIVANEDVTLTAIVVAEDAAINISGAGDVTVGTEDAKTITATGTGAVTLNGIDEAEDYSITLSSGDDEVNTKGRALDEDDTIDGGDGEDTLTVDYDITDGILDGVSNFEVVKLMLTDTTTANNDITVDMDAFNGNITSITVAASSTGAFDDFTINNFVSGSTVKITAATLVATAVGTLTADTDADAVANVTLEGSDTDGVDITTGLDVNNIATLNIVSAAGSKMSSTADNNIDIGAGSDALDTVNISGAANLKMTASETEVDVINAAEFTGELTLGVAGGAAGITVTGGTGDDTITVTAAVETTINGGAGDDTFDYGTTFDDNDVVDGGDGDDELKVTVNGYSDDLRVTNVETLTITDEATATADSTVDINGIGDFTSVNVVVAGAGGGNTDNVITIDDATASMTTLILDAAAGTEQDTVVFDLRTDTDADALTIRIDQDDTNFGDNVTADDPETVNIVFAYGSSTTGATAQANLATATFADATTVNITNTRADASATTYVAGNYLTVAKLDMKDGAVVDLTGWNYDVGIDGTEVTANMAKAALETATAAGANYSAGEIGTAGLTLVGADGVTVKLTDGQTDATSVMSINLGATNAKVDTIQFVDGSDTTNDIGAVILQNFNDAASNSATATTLIDLSAFGIAAINDLDIYSGNVASDGTNGGKDITFIQAADSDDFAGVIALVGVDSANVEAGNFVFASA